MTRKVDKGEKFCLHFCCFSICGNDLIWRNIDIMSFTFNDFTKFLFFQRTGLIKRFTTQVVLICLKKKVTSWKVVNIIPLFVTLSESPVYTKRHKTLHKLFPYEKFLSQWIIDHPALTNTLASNCLWWFISNSL